MGAELHETLEKNVKYKGYTFKRSDLGYTYKIDFLCLFLVLSFFD